MTNTEDSLPRRLRQFQADEPGFPPLFTNAAAEIERLNRRIAVLEKIINEELYVSGCQDDANEMIAEEIHERLGDPD